MPILSLKSFQKIPKAAKPEKPYYLFLISAKNEDSLTLRFRHLYHYLETRVDFPLQDIAYTLADRRDHYRYRGAMVVSSMDELLTTLKAITEGKQLKHVWRSQAAVQSSKPLMAETIMMEPVQQSNIQSIASSYFNKLALLAEGYIEGVEIHWGNYFQNQDCHLIELPTYAFHRQRYWSGDLCSITPTTPTSCGLPAGSMDLDPADKPRDIGFEAKEEESSSAAQYESVEEYLLTLISTVLKISKDVLDTTENLLEYGFDSITLSYLITSIENHFHVPIFPVVVMEHSTIADLAHYLELQIPLQTVTS